MSHEVAERTLAGKISLVTGSIGGLGLAIATRLAREGCDVMLHGLLSAEEADAERANLEKTHGTRVRYQRADLANPAEISALIAATNAELGGVDVLVNSAVVRFFAPVEKMKPAEWDTAIAVNLTAPFHAIRLTVPGMKARGWGRIINISSGYGLFATTDRADYITTKTGLIGLTRAVALETVRHGITCNAICPGTILTPAIEWRLEQEMKKTNAPREQAVEDFLATRQPSRKFVEADHVAGLIAFLCGPDGADMTGTALPIDGGWTAA
jgi:3-hydroxybutyrate dehydrogenase